MSDDQSNESSETSQEQSPSDPGNLHVTDGGGNGSPIVLIHGWPLSEDSWAPQKSALQDAGYRVVTYDRRGFGSSGPGDGYDYDKLAGDLDNIMSDLDLRDATLIGFSMGGGEVARYASAHGTDRLRAVIFAAAIPPALLKSDDNPDGPLDEESAQEMRKALEEDREAFFEDFTKNFFTAGDDVAVSEDQRKQALSVALKSDEQAALECMDAWGTDFRDDLESIDVPTLVIHGDSDAIVPLEGSGQRTHDAIEGSDLVVIEGGPHGLNTSHADEFNRALLDFLDGLGKTDADDQDNTASDDSDESESSS